MRELAMLVVPLMFGACITPGLPEGSTPSGPSTKVDFFQEGSATADLSESRIAALLDDMLRKMEASAPLKRVLIIPPDITRLHAGAGPITQHLYARLAGRAFVRVLPALGTHVPMTDDELKKMFPGVPLDAFLVHDWRGGVSAMGEIPGEVMARLSQGRLKGAVPLQLSRHLVEGKWDAVFSIGQLVPHEVAGIANQSKNIVVGVGGPGFINASHWLGAVTGIESIMGRADNPVREMFDEAMDRFGQQLPITYVLTVRQRLADGTGRMVTRGLTAGQTRKGFEWGAELARTVNLDWLARAPRKVVVYLDPAEFKSTWLGNKAIYRTRLAVATRGELVILAPGVRTFGEDPRIDVLIRKYGYRGTPATLAAVEKNEDLAGNLSAAAHLIHGSTEGRFDVSYCTGVLTRREIESVGFKWCDLSKTSARYDPKRLKDGWNTLADGEEIFFVSNPALGLWAVKG